MTEALKACPNPWCCARSAPLPCALKREGWVVRCECGVVTNRCPTEAEAIAAWNTSASERDMIVAWLRAQGIGAMKLMLAAGLPGGTRTERTKARAFADGYSRAVADIHAAIERGDHRKD